MKKIKVIEDLFENYIVEKKYEHAESTHRNARRDYASIRRCLIELNILKVSELSYESHLVIYEYLKKKCGVKNTTVNKYVGYVKAVLRHHGYLNHTFLLIKKLPNDVEPYLPVEHDLFNQILNYAKNKSTHANDFSYYALFVLLYETSCRITEILSIKKQNIILATNTIFLETHTTKGRAQRPVFFSDEQKGLIKKLISQNKEKHIFWNFSKDRPLTADDVRNYIRRMKVRLNIDRFHPHQVRKTSASDLAIAGANLKTVQTILGHKDQKTTEGYINYPAIVAKKEYDKIKNKKSQ